MLAIQPKRIKVWIRLHFLCLCALLELAASLCRENGRIVLITEKGALSPAPKGNIASDEVHRASRGTREPGAIGRLRLTGWLGSWCL